MTIIILYYLIFVFLNDFQLPDGVGAHVIIMMTTIIILYYLIFVFLSYFLNSFRVFELF